ncbi:hypothetical protein SUGI_0710390 [Cryptomeria japonica]|nr:hypothetical protein SUGI_0710390 [Cryptomeria japonica]
MEANQTPRPKLFSNPNYQPTILKGGWWAPLFIILYCVKWQPKRNEPIWKATISNFLYRHSFLLFSSVNSFNSYPKVPTILFLSTRSHACSSCDVWSNAIRPLILFLPFVELYDTKPPEVSIGGAFDLEIYQGKQSNVPIPLAIQDIDNNPNIVNGTILQFESTKIRSTALDEENEQTWYLLSHPWQQKSPTLFYVLVDSAQIPLITFAGNDPSISSKRSVYSIQMISRVAVQMKAIVVIYQEDELGFSSLKESSARIVQKFEVSIESFSNSS